MESTHIMIIEFSPIQSHHMALLQLHMRDGVLYVNEEAIGASGHDSPARPYVIADTVADGLRRLTLLLPYRVQDGTQVFQPESLRIEQDSTIQDGVITVPQPAPQPALEDETPT